VAGKIEILVKPGTRIAIGAVIARIDTSDVVQPEPAPPDQAPAKKEQPKKETPAEAPKTEEIKITPLARKEMEDQRLSIDDVLNGLSPDHQTRCASCC
jgi:pyruvate/2-oxoglutarate dehydrogenase complex dihydrolipoamide acyltransferase (E2) component